MGSLCPRISVFLFYLFLLRLAKQHTQIVTIVWVDELVLGKHKVEDGLPVSDENSFLVGGHRTSVASPSKSEWPQTSFAGEFLV